MPRRTLEELRDANGKLPTYGWPGGYPLLYLTGRGDVLCPACANATREDDPKDLPIASDANWEDPDLHCDDCGKRIESAYAEREGTDA